jgi:hypothetical protein
MKDYEQNFFEEKINYRFIAIILICTLVVGVLFYPAMSKSMEKPKVNLSNITIPTETPFQPIIQYVYVTPTPDKDNGQVYASEYNQGIRKLNRYFSWYRDNVTGLKDMSGHVKVYDYRLFKTYHWFNPNDYKYYEQMAGDGKQYLFVFAKIYLDDVIGDDTRMWVPNEFHYSVQIKDQIFYPLAHEKRLRIKELEETWNDNNDYRIQYYGTFRTYNRNLAYANTSGEIAEQIYYLKGGVSNAVDGFIIYEIPSNTNINDVIVLSNIYQFGKIGWVLKN